MVDGVDGRHGQHVTKHVVVENIHDIDIVINLSVNMEVNSVQVIGKNMKLATRNLVQVY